MGTPIFSNISLGYLFSVCPIFLFLLFSSKKGCALDGGDCTLQSHHHADPASSLLPAAVCSPSTKGQRKGASLKVVHRHGPCSQMSKDKTSVPTLSQILSHDQSRVNSIQSQIDLNSATNRLRDSQANLPAKFGYSIGIAEYIVTVGLGTPKKDLSLIFDTGSYLTWTQCQPCARYCYKQQQPIFNPSVSKTYKNITCNSAQCSQLNGKTKYCSSNTCVYGTQYGDGSSSAGFFGSETLTLTPAVVIPNFKFGCGQDNQDNGGLFGRCAGLLGLGRDPVSIVSQTASKYGKYFSYCLPSKSSSTGHLTFGKGRKSSALKSTPLLTNSKDPPSLYYIDIMGIKVCGKKLPISQSVFKKAGAIIDSGTTFTQLPPDAYAALRSAFRQGMKKYRMLRKGVPPLGLDTCYDLSKYRRVSIPTVSFTFGGNVEVPMALSGILYGESLSQQCLAFAGNSNATDVGIFGNVQQRTLEVVYDVAGGKLGFSTGRCS